MSELRDKKLGNFMGFIPLFRRLICGMKKFVFISDFDGTISNKDFYMHVIEKYLKEEGERQYARWRNDEILDIDFLSYVFTNIDADEEEIYKDIIALEIDSDLEEFIRYIKGQGGEFVILSAGSTYYIDILLEHWSIEGIKIYSNNAVYKNRGIHYDIDPTNEFYSERYGIDKKKVVEKLKGEYETLYYAGDSMPDFEASLLCEKRFAKGRLIDIYKQKMLITMG